MFLPHRTLLVSALATISLHLELASAQQTVSSVDGSVTYYCPTEATINAAYLSYCASQSLDGLPLDIARGYASYSNAPSSYSTNAGDFILTCEYANTDGSTQYSCVYTAGGGQPLTLEAYSNSGCPQVSQTVPQPSPGANYRKRAIDRRYDANVQYACPRTSSDQALYLESDGVATTVQTSEIDYECLFAGDVAPECAYSSDPGDSPTLANGPDTCPSTLCNAVAPVGGSGSNTRRGIFDERYNAIRKRQVITATLRQKVRR